MRPTSIPKWCKYVYAILGTKSICPTGKDRYDRFMDCLDPSCLEKVTHEKGDYEKYYEDEERPGCEDLFLRHLRLCETVSTRTGVLESGPARPSESASDASLLLRALATAQPNVDAMVQELQSLYLSDPSDASLYVLSGQGRSGRSLRLRCCVWFRLRKGLQRASDVSSVDSVGFVALPIAERVRNGNRSSRDIWLTVASTNASSH